MKKDIKIGIGSVLFGSLAYAGMMALLKWYDDANFQWAEFFFNVVMFSFFMTVITILNIRRQRKQKENDVFNK